MAARDLATIEPTWRALEANAPNCSFFQSWTWVGCLAEERYPDAVLVRAEAAGRVVGLALFNRRGRRLCLAESGDAVRDAPFIEHNGPLLADGWGPDLARAMFAAAWRVPGVGRLLLGGVSPGVVQAANGVVWRQQERVAPLVDLAAVRAAGGDFLATLSANTRYQVRRSLRHYEARGPLQVARAADEAQAQAWFEAMAALHGAAWRARGKPGAFANPFMRHFHAALLARALPRHEVDLLRMTAGDATLGYLYNFHHRQRVLAYQSGFNPDDAGAHGKPGISCHVLAIRRALSEGDAVYDFLAGADRYKTSLANAESTLIWSELARRWSPSGFVAEARRTVQNLLYRLDAKAIIPLGMAVAVS